MNGTPPVPIATESVTAAGRSLQAPSGEFFSSHQPLTAGALRGMTMSFAVLVLTAGFETLRQWGGLPPATYLIWAPVVQFAVRLLEAWRDQQTVV